MLNLVLFWWILTNMNAPDWCWILWWIMIILQVFSAIVEFIKLGMKLG